jgi:peptide/nickel transport system permease protein
VRSRTALIALRVSQAVPTIIGVIVVTFIMTRMLPGDPAVFFAGPTATPESIAEIRVQLGLDKTWIVQFWLYLQALATGDLGQSLVAGRPVLEEIVRRLPASLELTFFGLTFAISIALPLGVLAATHPNSWIDHLCRFVVTLGVSLPTFFTGLLLIYIFYYLLGLSPSPVGRLDFSTLPPPYITGFYTIDGLIAGQPATFWRALGQLILPAVTLGVFALAPIARMTRAAMLQVLSSDFVRAARAAGLRRHTVLFTYAFRNAMLPVLTTLGIVFSFMLGANVLVEKVYAWPGIGSFALEALVASDYAAIQGFVLTMTLLFVVLNLIIDVIYTLVDPRIELTG